MIKKRCYFRREIRGDGTNEYFGTKNVGGVGCISGEWDNTEFYILL